MDLRREATGRRCAVVSVLELEARAKVNILLRVLARDGRGYHSIETLFPRLELADRVVLTPGETGIHLTVTGDPTVPCDRSNLCWRAAELVAEAAGRPAAVTIELEKRVPSGAGLGGGSADAAAVLRGMNVLLGEPLRFGRLLELAGRLGSDVPFALADVDMALGWERGRRLLPLAPPPSLPALLLVPGYGIAASDAYDWLARDRDSGVAEAAEGSSSDGPGLFPLSGQLTSWTTLKRIAGNDLEGPVFRRHPDLRRALGGLRDTGADPAVMCGSGSCLIGVFDDEGRRNAAAALLPRRTGLASLATRTSGHG